MKCFSLIWTLLLILQLGSSLARQDYKNYKLFELQPRNDAQQRLLLQLSQQSHIDFMTLTQRSNESMRVVVSPRYTDKLIAQLDQHNIQHQLLIDDLWPLIRAQRVENLRSKSHHKHQLPYIDALEGFYTHAEINAYLDSLPQRYPQRAFVKNFGRSFEKRTLKLLNITNGDGQTNKPVIFIDAAMHAREWIGPSMALYIIQQLLDNNTSNEELLRTHDWIIMPVVNADGYEYTHTEDRYWRKTRRPLGADCVGIDLNRNFGYEWGHDTGSSSDACEEIYRGERAFSEPESQVVRDILLHYAGRLKWYLSLHSYGNYILLPWGYSSELPINYEHMMEIAEVGAMAIVQATNSIYSYGSTHHVLYETSGDSVDYAVGVANATLAMTWELPAGGFSGFDPWVTHIEGLVTETWIGVRAMALDMIRHS